MSKQTQRGRAVIFEILPHTHLTEYQSSCEDTMTALKKRGKAQIARAGIARLDACRLLRSRHMMFQPRKTAPFTV